MLCEASTKSSSFFFGFFSLLPSPSLVAVVVAPARPDSSSMSRTCQTRKQKWS